MHARHFLFLTSNFLLLTSMFVRQCLPPYEHVCICLSIHAYVPECILYVCKHASILVCACMCMREYVWVRPFIHLFVCPRACLCIRMFVRTCMHSSMHAFKCLHACGHMFESICLSVHMHVHVSKCLFDHACIHQCMCYISYFYFLLLTSNLLLLTSMIVLGCLPPYEHACVRLSIRAYLPECIVCACKHASVSVRACVRRMCEPIHPSDLSVPMHVHASKCLIVHASISMLVTVCWHARMPEGVCFESVRSSICLSVCLFLCMFVHPNVCSHKPAFINAGAAFLIFNF